ncbi:protein kinase domain-containing protein [Streptomyces venezuelae]|nr:protein kinase [Streptomyces venezuelae]
MKPLEPGDPASVGEGRYRLTGRLGQGGMGVVYLGRSQSGRAVAVKVVRPELSTEPGFRRRFADEVAAARRVGGFHTAPVVDADPEADPAWLVTAFVPGPTLAAVIGRVGALPVDTLTVLAAGLAEALEAIHRAGVIHRDLKPANIIVAEDGPRVIDFGIARALDGTALTQTGLQVGTPGFLAPEQLTGGTVTPAVDMFALGVVLTQAAGGSPFGDGPSAARHYKVVHEEPDLRAVPGELLELIAACLSKDPAGRPTPGAFLDRLTVRHPAGEGWLPDEATRLLPRQDPADAADPAGAAAPEYPLTTPDAMPAGGGAPDTVTATGPAPAEALPGAGTPPAPGRGAVPGAGPGAVAGGSAGPGPGPAAGGAAKPTGPVADAAAAAAGGGAVPGQGPGAVAGAAPGGGAGASPGTPPARAGAARPAGPVAGAAAAAAGGGAVPSPGPGAVAGASPHTIAAPAEAAGTAAAGAVPDAGADGASPGTAVAAGSGTTSAPAPAGPEGPAGRPGAGAGARPGPGAGEGAGPGPGGAPAGTAGLGPGPAAGAGPVGYGAWVDPGASVDEGRRTRRRAGAVVAAVLVAATVGVLVWQPWRGGSDDGANGAGGPSTPPASATPTGPAPYPTDAMLVRTDTAKGWPQNCHGRIARREGSTTAASKPLVSGTTCDMLPQWAPDRRSFAFTRVTPDGASVWAARADGSAEYRIAAIAGGRVSWSPDGKRLAVLSVRNGVQQLFVITLATGSARQLTTGSTPVEDPAWSPDGRQIAVSLQAGRDNWQIHLVDPEAPGSAPRQVTRLPHPALDPVWSPDGRTFAYTAGTYGTSTQGDIRLVGSDGGNDRALVSTGHHEMDPSWSPDGSWLAFVRGPYEEPAIWAVRADGTDERKVGSGSEGHPAWR